MEQLWTHDSHQIQKKEIYHQSENTSGKSVNLQKHKTTNLKKIKLHRILLEYSQLNPKLKQENFHVSVWHNNQEINTSANDATIHNFYRKKHWCYDLYANDIPDELQEKRHFMEGSYWLYDFKDPYCIELSSDEANQNGEICITLNQIVEDGDDNDGLNKLNYAKQNSHSQQKSSSISMLLSSTTIDMNNCSLTPCHYQSKVEKKYSVDFKMIAIGQHHSNRVVEREKSDGDSAQKSYRFQIAIDGTLFVFIEEQEVVREENILTEISVTNGSNESREDRKEKINNEISESFSNKNNTKMTPSIRDVLAIKVRTTVSNSPAVDSKTVVDLSSDNNSKKVINRNDNANSNKNPTPLTATSLPKLNLCATTSDSVSKISRNSLTDYNRIVSNKMNAHQILDRHHVLEMIQKQNSTGPVRHGIGTLSYNASRSSSRSPERSSISSRSMPTPKSKNLIPSDNTVKSARNDPHQKLVVNDQAGISSARTITCKTEEPLQTSVMIPHPPDTTTSSSARKAPRIKLIN
jgi:hypothetical protein